MPSAEETLWGFVNTPERPAVNGRCAECDARLAHDQRYCVQCGARRGAVPAYVAPVLGKVAAGSGAAAAARGAVTGAAAAGASRASTTSSSSASAKRRAVAGGGFLSSLTPRAAGVAVMAMLAFGVVVGSGASSLANSGAPLLVALARKPAAPATTTSAVAATSTPPAQHSSPPQTQQTVTATAPAQTVTAAAPSTTTSGGGTSTTPANPSGLPPVKHVFLIVLSGEGYQQMYGADTDLPYLAHHLLPKGELLTNYYAVAQSPLANAVALISGQGPTQQTVADCPTFTAIAPATLGHDGQVLGDGCTYPNKTLTLANQLTAKGYTWKAYVEGINDGPTGVAKTCRRPTLGAADPATAPQTGDPYVTWRNPFVYFDSLTARKACGKDDVGLGQLSRDLRSKKTTPSFSYIVPGACDDGSQLPCVPGATPDPQQSDAATDAFLKSVVPAIERSPAYKARRPDRDHLRRGPAERSGRGSERVLQQPDLPQPPGRRDDGADHDDDLDDDRLVVDHDGGPVDGFDAHDDRDHERGDQHDDADHDDGRHDDDADHVRHDDAPARRQPAPPRRARPRPPPRRSATARRPRPAAAARSGCC